MRLELLQNAKLWFSWFKTEKPFIGNIGHLYGQFKDEIEALFSKEERTEIYQQEKAAWLKYVNEKRNSMTESDYNILTDFDMPASNLVAISRAKDRLMKKLFTHYVKENKEV